VTHVIVWEFHVRAGRETEFEAVYGATGDWARLFARSPDFIGTELYEIRLPNDYPVEGARRRGMTLRAGRTPSTQARGLVMANEDDAPGRLAPTVVGSWSRRSRPLACGLRGRHLHHRHLGAGIRVFSK